jgi:hypothetical protein
MTYLKRAMMERPDLDPKTLVLFHCPADYGFPVDACPKTAPGDTMAPPTLCYLCWNREVQQNG